MAVDFRVNEPKVLISANPHAACRVIERGPNWLFICAPRGRLLGFNRQRPTLSEEIWQIADRHLIYRIILHLEEVEGLDVSAAAEIAQLQKMLNESKGSLRLCGLRPDCGRQLIHDTCCDKVHNYATPHDAVLGYPCNDEATNFEQEKLPEQPIQDQRSTIRKQRKILPR